MREQAVLERVHSALEHEGQRRGTPRPALREIVVSDLLCVPGDNVLPGALFLTQGPRGVIHVTRLPLDRLRAIHAVMGQIIAAQQPHNPPPSA